MSRLTINADIMFKRKKPVRDKNKHDRIWVKGEDIEEMKETCYLVSKI